MRTICTTPRSPKKQGLRPAAAASEFKFRLGDRSAPFLVSAAPFAAGATADADIEEVPVADLLRRAGVGFSAWPAPSWAKEGWFQAYQALRPAIGTDAGEARRPALRSAHA